MPITYNESGVTYNSIFYTYNGGAGGDVFTISIGDSIGITDVLARTTNLNRFVQESMGITDSISRLQASLRAVADSLGIADTTSKVSSVARSLQDNEGLTDNLISALNYVISLTDNIGLTDSRTSPLTLNRFIVDNSGLTDTIASVQQLLRSNTDSVGITDVVSFTSILSRSIQDAINLSDQLVRATQFVGRTVSKYIGIKDIKPLMVSVYNRSGNLEVIVAEKPKLDSVGRTIASFATSTIQYSQNNITYNDLTTQYGGSNRDTFIGQTPSFVTTIKPQITRIGEIC